MDPYALPLTISLAATAIAKELDDELEIAFLAAVLTQLADTLVTIVAQKALFSRRFDRDD